MGKFGFAVGHEIGHGFDNTGGRFRHDGSIHDWWTENSRQTFNSKANCLVHQYESIEDEKTEFPVNGTHTLSDNIADNAGVSVAFSSWKRVSGEPLNQQLLPGMEEWTPDQLFFLSYANVSIQQLE